jgi:hypothetical protein
MLTDFFFFVATPHNVEDITVDWAYYESFPMIQAKSVDPVKLATLEHVLTKTDLQELFGLVEDNVRWVRTPEEPLEESEESKFDETIVYWVRPELVNALASLNHDQISFYTFQWAETEEWKLDRAAADDLSPFLKDLAELAVRTVAENKNIYLRMLP